MIQGENFVIEKQIMSYPSDKDGWNVELNLVAWFGRKASYEIRKWNEDHSKSSKGVTLSEDEVVLMFQRADDVLKHFSGVADTVEEDPVNEEKSSEPEDELPFN